MDVDISKFDFIIRTLTKLFDVESVPESETEYFKKNNVSHAKLSRIFEYWIDQSKSIFGEPITIHQTQSLRDSGVDFIVEFISSRFKIGFQIKSYGDVKDKYFHKNVNAQITESKRYDLQKLVIAIVGNLADEKVQGQKIRGLIAELKQRNDDYLFIIPPEKVLPICKAFETRQHPLSIVMLDLKDAFKISDGLSKSLSNKNRKVNVSINVKYLNIPKQKGEKTGKFLLKLKPEDLGIFDRFERLNITGETLEFTKEQLSEFIVDGKNWLDEGFQKLEVRATEEYDTVTINILDDKEVVIMELEELTFGKRRVGEEAHITLRDKNQESLRIEFKGSKNMINFSCGVNFYNVDLNHIRQAVEFRRALEEGKWIQILVPKHGVDAKFPITSKTESKKIDENLVKVADALLVIEERSGIKLKIPKELWQKEIDRIIGIAKLIIEEVFPLKKGGVDLTKKEAESFVKLFKNPDKYKEFTIITEIDILDKKIPAQIECFTSDYELEESIEDNLKKIIALDKGLIEIKIKSLSEESLARITLVKSPIEE